MEPGKVLYRQVSRLPAGVILRLDALAVAAAAATGKEVSRAAIIRAVLSAGLESAKGDVGFASTVGCALVKRGRKAGSRAVGLALRDEEPR
jgi:hypothetical protein